MGRARPDANINYSLIAVSSSDGSTPVELWADPSTHLLQTSASASLAGSTIPASGLMTAVAVQIVDGSGNQISSFGGGTQYTDAGVPPAHPVAPTLLFNNAGAWATVGSATPLPVTGSLTVGGTTDNSAFTAGTTTGTPTMGFYHSTIDTVTDGRAAAVGITNKRAMLVTLQTSAGADTGVAASPLQVSLANTASNSTAVKVDGSAVTQPVSGTVAIGAGAAVIGHVITDTGSTTAVTGTVTISGAVTEATLDAALISQEANTSSVKGLTVFGAVTTNAPTYTTAKSDALSLDTSGLLRVSLKDTPANTNKLLVTADAITFASPQHVIADSGTISTITNVVHVDDNSGSLTVDNGGTFAVQATIASGATSIAKAEDVASADADVGVPALAVRKASPANTSGTDGDYEFLQISAGRLWASATIDAALPAGAAVIGKVSIDQTTPGTTNLVALTAETTKVIGVTRTSDGAGNLLTSNSTTYTAKFGLDANILGTLGTAFSTAGKVDVKGADGDVFVRQTTAANLNATVVQGTAAALTGGWPTINGEAADTTGTFTNATQATSITASNLNGYGNVLISINGTYGTATAVFEGSDDGGTTWYGISEADRTDSNIIESGYTSLTNTTRAWQISNPGWDSVRVRSTAVASGTVNVRISPSGAPTAAGASVSIGVALPAGNAVIGHVITDTGSTTAVTGTVAVTESGTWNVGSSTATGSAVPANAFYNGVNAQTALPTAATAGNLTGATADKFGRAVVLPGTIRDLVGTQTTTIAASTSETTIVTAAASVFNDLTALVVSNTSATAVRVDFRDTTAGSVLFSIYVPAGDTRGVAFNRPVPQTSVNTNWTATSSASVTDLRIYAVWDKNR